MRLCFQMKKYCLNKELSANGFYEVHSEGCSYLPKSEDQISLGYKASPEAALEAAQKLYPEVKDKIKTCDKCIILTATQVLF